MRKNIKEFDPKLAGNFIKNFEGLRLKAYVCHQDKVSGIFTIGWGHTKNVKEDDEISVDQAESYLIADLVEHFDCLKKLVKVRVSENQFIALMSFIFNLGATNLSSSTLLKKLNQEDYEGAGKEFPRWCYSGKKVVQGLLNRRNAEMKLFNA